MEIVKKLCYLGDIIGAREGTVDIVLTRIDSEWDKMEVSSIVLRWKTGYILHVRCDIFV